MATKATEIIFSEESRIPGLKHSPARLSFSLLIGWSLNASEIVREKTSAPPLQGPFEPRPSQWASTMLTHTFEVGLHSSFSIATHLLWNSGAFQPLFTWKRDRITSAHLTGMYWGENQTMQKCSEKLKDQIQM